MESNGKHVTLAGEHVGYETGAVYWGEPGTNGQHSFYQLLHQGAKLIPVDLIGFGESINPLRDHHDILVLGTSSRGAGTGVRQDRGAGARGGHARGGRAPQGNGGQSPHERAAGEKLTPTVLGSLVALYEHSVFTQGAIWNVDSFDQWGVELGKALAKAIIPELESESEPQLSTTRPRTC